MSYDLKILVLNQSEPCKIPFNAKFELLNEIDHNEYIARYHTIWPYMTQSRGIWYTIVRDKEKLWHGALHICDSDFEIEEKKIKIPYWVKDNDDKSNLTPLIINEEYSFDFIKTIEYLINQSPNKTILFLARYQGGEEEKEIICGILAINEFMELLNKKEILFNICYIIRGNID